MVKVMVVEVEEGKRWRCGSGGGEEVVMWNGEGEEVLVEEAEEEERWC